MNLSQAAELEDLSRNSQVESSYVLQSSVCCYHVIRNDSLLLIPAVLGYHPPIPTPTPLFPKQIKIIEH